MKYRDTDYLYATMRVRANEKNLLSAQKIERMIDAKTPEEAAKTLAESGYGDVSVGGIAQIERVIADMRAETIKLISDITKNRAIAETFALKYDFHNIKAVIKAEMTGADAERLLSASASVPPQKLVAAMQTGDMRELPGKMAGAISEAREAIAHTGDPQLADFILDRACFSMMADAAKESGSAFLEGYVRLMTDAANLRTAVRAARQNRDADILRSALIPGGNVEENAYLTGEYRQEFAGSDLAPAAEAGEAAALGKSGLTEFERLLDNALIRYMQSARYAAFDERPLAAYIAAKEAEAMTIRIIMAGKLENLSADEIRSRLRLSYV